MSLILVATVGGVLLVRLRRCPPDGRVGVRRGGARDTAGNGERAAHRRVRPTIVPDDARWPPGHRTAPSGGVPPQAGRTSTRLSENVGARPRSAKTDGLTALTVAPRACLRHPPMGETTTPGATSSLTCSRARKRPR